MDQNIFDNLPVEILIYIMKKLKSPNFFFCSKKYLELLPLSNYHNNIVCINKKDQKNILKISVENGYLNILKYIDWLNECENPLAKHIKFNCDRNILLKISLKSGNNEIIKYISSHYFPRGIEKEYLVKLIKYCGINTIKPLFKNFYKYNISCTRCILDSMVPCFCDGICNCQCVKEICDYNTIFLDYLIPASLKYGNFGAFKYFYKKNKFVKKDSFLFLKLACEFGHLKIVKYLVKKSVKYDNYNYFVIQLALSKKHYRIAKYLLSLINTSSNKNIKNISWLDILDEIIYNGHNDKIKDIVISKKAVTLFKNYNNTEIIKEIIYKKNIFLHMCKNITIERHKNILDLIILNWNKKYIDKLLKYCSKNLDHKTVEYIMNKTIK
ncbi:ankyrin repeat protein [Moumouvirus australiensis]|uniref:Ankyrin repeat protein n=1 Tax=Moumouvirus australiensis TaxID=2109587 RepID=A0A2P1EKP4_9VIRU|nr:ankyrin repeat protein [Moumouvirus australiensis]AVL94449.1 ankyrin repeat protein [Moumouvirus australiensis]